jgi:stalled ribosome alternative rescue factor ArfA
MSHPTNIMKINRSTVGKGQNLSTRVINQRKGKGAYVRKNRYNKWD